MTCPDSDYLAHLSAGYFMIQRDVESGAFVFPPRAVAPGSGAALEWVEASGNGIVHATTVVRRKPPEPSYNVALIEMDEGPRMMSRVDGTPPQDVRIGMLVRARIIEENAVPIVVFEIVA